MNTFSNNDEVQKLGCKVLHVLFERGTKNLLNFNVDKYIVMGNVGYSCEEEKVSKIILFVNK